MAERIDFPPTLQGDEKAQLQQLWSYLYQMSEAINGNLDAIGGNDLTDSERKSMQEILQAAGVTQDGVSTDYETLKSLIIKTADFVQTSLQEYRTVLFGETVASSQFGQVNRRTGMDVAVTPDGVLQKFSLREIVKDLKTYEVNAKNYIKTGYLRTENNIPVYGVTIGKDVVTFSADGTETYNDGNKVAELTADELSFWQNNVKIAKYTGSRISFLYNGTEAFYIQNGKWYAVGDMEITNGKKLILASGADMEVSSGGDLIVKSGGSLNVESGGNIDIHASGSLELTGSAVAIKSNSTFSVDSTNLKIDSQSGVFKTHSTSSLVPGGLDYVIGTHAIDGDFISSCYPTVETGAINGSTYKICKLNTNLLDKIMYPGYVANTSFSIGFFDVYRPEFDSYEIVQGIQLRTSIYEESTYVQQASKSCVFAQSARFVDWMTTHKGYIEELHYSAMYQNSSRYKKQNIKPMEPIGDKIDKLEPVTFIYKKDKDGKRRTGLIYEDTINVMPEICTENNGDKAINYVEMIPMLLKEIQDLRARVKALEER